MKVWYSLPRVEERLLDSIHYRQNKASALFSIHSEIIEPFRVWMLEHKQDVKPEFKWGTDYFTWEVHAAVGFELPDELATLFLLKFGDGHQNT